KARDLKPIGNVFDLTLVLADMGEKALAQVKRGAAELLTPRMDQAAAEALADKLAGGHWTHDYALTATEARELGLPVKVGMSQEVLALRKLSPQPVQQQGIEYLPIDIPGTAECDGDTQIFKSGKPSDPLVAQLAHDRFWQILLQKSFCTGDQKFSRP